LEIIVIDDGSTDETEEILRKHWDDKLIYIKMKVNKGAPVARNIGITYSKGDCVAFLDADDEWFAQKLEKQMALLNNLSSDFGLVYSGFDCINSCGRLVRKSLPVEEGSIYSQLLVSNCVGTLSTVLLKKKYLMNISGFDESLKSCQDWDLYLRLSRICKFCFVNESLTRYTEGHTFSRISSKPESVISGQNIISNKYKKDIDNLDITLQAARLNYVGRIMLSGGAFKVGFNHIRKASILGRNPFFLIRGFVFFIKIIFRKFIMY